MEKKQKTQKNFFKPSSGGNSEGDPFLVRKVNNYIDICVEDTL